MPLPLQAHATAHQMSDFKAKMHLIRFRLGLRPRPRLQIGFLNILDMILSRASGGSAPEAWTPDPAGGICADLMGPEEH